MEGYWLWYAVVIHVNIIGDTAIDGMGAMAGYNALLFFSGGWLQSCNVLLHQSYSSRTHPPAIGACTFLSVPDAFPVSSLAVPDHTPSPPPTACYHPISADGRKRVEALWFPNAASARTPETTMGRMDTRDHRDHRDHRDDAPMLAKCPPVHQMEGQILRRNQLLANALSGFPFFSLLALIHSTPSPHFPVLPIHTKAGCIACTCCTMVQYIRSIPTMLRYYDTTMLL